MHYFRFEARIKRLVLAASEKSRFRFAQDTLLLLHRAAAETLANDFTQERQQLLTAILAKINTEATIELKARVAHFGVIGFVPMSPIC